VKPHTYLAEAPGCLHERGPSPLPVGAPGHDRVRRGIVHQVVPATTRDDRRDSGRPIALAALGCPETARPQRAGLTSCSGMGAVGLRLAPPSPRQTPGSHQRPSCSFCSPSACQGLPWQSPTK
jgi:hypothetical protein